MAVKLRALLMVAATLQMVASAPSGSTTSTEGSTPRLLSPIAEHPMGGSESGKTPPLSPVHSWPTRPNSPPSPDYKNDPKFNLMLQDSDSDREHWSDEEQRQAHAKQIRGESLAGPLSPTSASEARNSILALHFAKDPEHAHERAMREYAALDDADKGRRLESWLAQNDYIMAHRQPGFQLGPLPHKPGSLEYWQEQNKDLAPGQKPVGTWTHTHLQRDRNFTPEERAAYVPPPRSPGYERFQEELRQRFDARIAAGRSSSSSSPSHHGSGSPPLSETVNEAKAKGCCGWVKKLFGRP
ncbi:hypothetical protein CBOM_05366 [Ceraceosorus bombacis]|uniref:Uncharacterized protein n=1 Tax=Ceraceosorus bombacis TaxID=401625 RepID=A0A0P1BNZ9_9BASI|nr:hypothetical protein CBOM_05366 [Ceraceosorus bombacis]